MSSYPEQDAIISGIGISDIGRKTGTPGIDLTMQSVRAAIADAGLEPTDIDAILTLGDTPADETAQQLGIEPGKLGGPYGDAGLLAPVQQAAVAVGEKRARHVLVYRTVQMMGGTVDRPKRPGEKPRPRRDPRPVMSDVPYLLAADAYSAANWLAMHCRRHMYEYGTTREQLGAIALNARANAALNPAAVFRDAMTMDDYLGARTVSTPFGLLDCDVPVDGSIAVVVSHRDHESSAPNPAIRFAAIGGASGVGGWTQRPDYPKMAATEAASTLWSRTDLTPADVDIAELYDGFTFLTLAWLEALGFCGDGEGGPFVEGGIRIGRDGELPLNTYGGQLSAGRMHGYWVLHEACLQLRREAGDRQVAKPLDVAAVSVGGGPIAGCLLLTR
ncbi:MULTISPECIES: thiolase family protein [Gordonia]|uniref:Thiolase family protein n=1 Tax=Gordonia amicalis TaxID=89053 RepID=A0ABU4DDM6_9ACTN|nr:MULTISPECIES: thiolase family protein [Gordonia]ATD72288.1 acetyl-CoA acetyltransferase [Gordonia sp. 1D]MCR8895984.1 thiolase family protein [Gordonia sp. GONU]MCZ4651541.1 thiolase family protein [Gordonia amicalis]MDJ0452574.1 thiolase family protein [Gordonia amicalis]MDV6307852.1 thiolase family protein [Gordonia amicalis]